MHKAVLFEELKNNQVKCLACSHYCRILSGKTGICGVRRNENGKLYLLVYGKPISVNVDPIEKKPLFHFLPGTDILSIGTLGCNFGCDFCQNWDISQPPRTIKQKFKTRIEQDTTLKRIIDRCEDFPPKKIVEYTISRSIPSIAYTYNEPAVFFEYAYDTAKLAHKKGIKNIFVSNGYESEEALKKIKPHLDALNIDLKSFSEEFYRKICKAKLKPVLENIKRVHDMGFWLEITTLIIPGHNDSENELTQIAKFIVSVDKSIPWHVTAFSPNYKMLNVPPTPLTSLLRAYRIGKKAGLKYVYTGNVADLEHGNTFCPNCNKILIGRNWRAITVFNIENRKCKNCNEKIEGIWK